MKLNENFLRLYSDIASDKRCTVLDVLREDGDIVINDTVDEKYKGVIELHNCMNNPFYFLDKLKIDIDGKATPMSLDITGFMTIKLLHVKKNNVVSDHAKGTHVNDLIIGYMIYKLLFTDDYVIFNSTDKTTIESINAHISFIYEHMPKYLKIKSLDSILSRILHQISSENGIKNIKDSNKNIGLIVYINTWDFAPSKFLLDTGISTVISNTGGNSRNVKYRFNKDHSGHNFKIINYDIKTLRYSNEWIENAFEKLNYNTDEFIKEIFMLYDEMTDEEAEKLEESFKTDLDIKSE